MQFKIAIKKAYSNALKEMTVTFSINDHRSEKGVAALNGPQKVILSKLQGQYYSCESGKSSWNDHTLCCS